MRNLLLLLSLLYLGVITCRASFAQGNLQLVFRARSGKSTENRPLTDNLTALWCQAVVKGSDGDYVKLPIQNASFLHFSPNKKFNARVENRRAYLDLGKQNLYVAGKYKCEIKTSEEEMVHGNLFIYLRPVFHTNSSFRLELKDDDNLFEFNGPSAKAVRGTTGVLDCPARGYPHPDIRWFKDGEYIEPSDKYKIYRNQLSIFNVADEDEGLYRCVASNEFPVHLDAEPTKFDLVLDQQLRVTGSLDWLVPLIVIIIILILLFVVIYSCAYWKKRAGRKSYDVAKEEKNAHNSEHQRLRDDQD
ncbi:unnamed protein product [Bursaphelenchus xylophilus]|uniref:(pine wood nematode) hypothetical protein n=1 Tax=Bursaphelenchus xylophilus TaxID=6326 RepID=A0A1I7S8B9_BURXY|nr:unnamed protein product [Bursaphelenchus xylophilus]CAG9120932.1 unnamed protein product [Bursaphelenchus xylophilus]